MMDKLKPCPFCGGTGDILRHKVGREYSIAGFKMAKVESYRKIIDYSEVKP